MNFAQPLFKVRVNGSGLAGADNEVQNTDWSVGLALRAPVRPCGASSVTDGGERGGVTAGEGHRQTGPEKSSHPDVIYIRVYHLSCCEVLL